MKVSEIWKYPIKTMAGEKLQHARAGPFGIGGDRVVQVRDARGRVITSRTHPLFLVDGVRNGCNQDQELAIRTHREIYFLSALTRCALK